jgi:hypothetical protein
MSTPADALPTVAAGQVAPKPAIQPVAAAPKNKAALDLIDAWFVERFHNSVTSRDTDVFNHCLAAKEDLKRRVASL